MPLKIHDTLEAIPEAQRAGAIKTHDGKFAIVEETGDGGKKAIDDEREARTKADQRARAAEDARKAAERERDELKLKADAAAKGITAEALKELQDKEAEKMKPLQDENAQLKTKLRKVLLSDRLEAKLLAAGVMPDRVAKAKTDLLSENVTAAGAQFRRVDLTDDGEGFVVKDANGKMTATAIDEFLTTDYKKEAPFFYEGSGGSGSGTGGSETGGSTGYDPVAAGKAAAEAQKKERKGADLAFR